MKPLILSHATALKAIRHLRINNLTSLKTNDEIKLSMIVKQNAKIDILVKNRNQFYASKTYRMHLVSKHIPKNSYWKISEKIALTNPELTIIHMSNSLNYIELSLLCMEFCGTYSINNLQPQVLQTNIKPITSISKILKYVDKYSKINKWARGIKKLRFVLKYVKDNSSSPMESRLFLKLCGPKNLGLYGCKNFTLNTSVPLSKKSKRICGQSIVVPDISNKSYKIAIEYDSAQFHESTIQGQKDKRRRDALVNDGWKVFTIVPAQINNPYTFDIIARQILKSANQDYRIRIKNFENKRNTIFKSLL